MRLATFAPKSDPRTPRLGALLGGRMLDLHACERSMGGSKPTIRGAMRELLALGNPGLDHVRELLDYAQAHRGKLAPGTLLDLGAVNFLPPIPDAEKFLSVGKNYRTHLEELKRTDLIIEHFSRLMPLEPGDMFSTGAPGGVAVGKPNAEALFLKPGDVVECAFEEPAMMLRNRIAASRA